MRYFGSVRFYKNLILLTVLILIAVPTGISVHLNTRLSNTEQLLEQQKEASSFPPISPAPETASPQTADLSTGADTAQPEPELLQADSPYAELFPDFYAPQTLDANVRESGVLYLTFDDGPSARTEEILDILAEKNVKAAFFVVGFRDDDETKKAILQRIVREGHTLGMHSFSHDYTRIYASVEDYLNDMYQIFSLIKETTGTAPTLFRFPGGSINGYNSGIYQDLISEMLRRGFVPNDWNISSADAAAGGPVASEVLVSNVLNGAAKVQRGIVLMHDSAARTTTVQALAQMIDGLREQGFELKALTPEVRPILYVYRD